MTQNGGEGHGHAWQRSWRGNDGEASWEVNRSGQLMVKREKGWEDGFGTYGISGQWWNKELQRGGFA